MQPAVSDTPNQPSETTVLDGFVASRVIRGRLCHSLTPPVQQPYHPVSNWAESIASNLASGTKSIGASDLQIQCLRRNTSRVQNLLCVYDVIFFHCVRYWCPSTLDVFRLILHRVPLQYSLPPLSTIIYWRTTPMRLKVCHYFVI